MPPETTFSPSPDDLQKPFVCLAAASDTIPPPTVLIDINVMTLDTSRPAEGGGYGGSDVDVLAGLWEEAPFARLPWDAPNELRHLVEDIENPKRVYAVHKASRRHNFQLLVQK